MYLCLFIQILAPINFTFKLIRKRDSYSLLGNYTRNIAFDFSTGKQYDVASIVQGASVSASIWSMCPARVDETETNRVCFILSAIKRTKWHILWIGTEYAL